MTRLATMKDHPWAACGRVYTIHNLALQGEFTPAIAERFAIGRSQLAPLDGLAPGTMHSAMAQGIALADRVNTVSDTYAKEILTREYGAGLDGLLRARAERVSGIVNGIDYEEFDPKTDAALHANYDVDSLDERAANKRTLQHEAGLPDDAGTCMFGVVTRLFAQKGIDLVPEAFEAMGDAKAQLVVLGTGDADVHEALEALEAKYPQRVKVWLDFHPALGQRIYGGCDVFMMPSRYEPCGLGQLISLRYGAIPLVRRTGGLNDTVEDCDESLSTGTGFVFEQASVDDLGAAMARAARAFENHNAWRGVQVRGMKQDWSWGRAAAKYAQLYEMSRADRRVAVK
jgi:starch synthase